MIWTSHIFYHIHWCSLLFLIFLSGWSSIRNSVGEASKPANHVFNLCLMSWCNDLQFFFQKCCINGILGLTCTSFLFFYILFFLFILSGQIPYISQYRFWRIVIPSLPHPASPPVPTFPKHPLPYMFIPFSVSQSKAGHSIR